MPCIHDVPMMVPCAQCTAMRRAEEERARLERAADWGTAGKLLELYGQRDHWRQRAERAETRLARLEEAASYMVHFHDANNMQIPFTEKIRAVLKESTPRE